METDPLQNRLIFESKLIEVSDVFYLNILEASILELSSYNYTMNRIVNGLWNPSKIPEYQDDLSLEKRLAKPLKHSLNGISYT